MQPSPDATDDEFSTFDLIAEARRPILIERHRRLIEEMESSLSDAFITGETDNPRLLAILKELEADSERNRVARTMRILAEDTHYKDGVLRNSLVEQLCLLREEDNIEVATLQMHVIGVYRSVRRDVAARQGEAPSLADLREMPTAMLGRILNPNPPEFGSLSLPESLVYTPAFAERSLRTIRRLRRAEKADNSWEDVNGEPPIPREMEEPLKALGEIERREARKLLVQNRIRHYFYHAVFLSYFSRDEFDPKDAEPHPTVLHWLEAVENTAHLYPFMQGQTTGQKRFRLAQLVQKTIQLHEVYARVALASQHPSYRDVFSGKSTRERLAIMAREHVPPLQLTPELTLAALLCPFTAFITWVQNKVAANDFLLPPDPKR
jgi:hypothetical protein